MRVDTALLDRAIRDGIRHPVVRFYRWSSPALSVGAHQRLSDELLERCEAMDVEVVRRATGGSAVLHGRDLTYSVVAPHGRSGVMEVYSDIAGALIDGLDRLGIRARIGGRRDPALRQGPMPLGSRSACFATTVGADLQVGGAKICGSAQVRRRGWFLQHGSIPLADDRPLIQRLLRHPAPIGSTCMEQLRPGTSEEELASCLVFGFESRWGTAREVGLEEATTNVQCAG